MTVSPGRQHWGSRLAMLALVSAQIVVGVAINLLTNSWNWVVLCLLVITAMCWVVLETRRSMAATQSRIRDRSPSAGTSMESLVPPWGLRPRQIRGRDDIVSVLTRLMGAPDGCVHVLHGMGGCGKTAIALEVCARAQRQGLQAWWLRVPDAASLDTALLALVAALGVDEARIDLARSSTQRLWDLVWSLLDQISAWVLVFDNVDVPESLTVGDLRVRDGNGAIRGSRTGLVLVTSRQNERQVWGDGAVLHPVDVLSAADGARVLLDDSGGGAGTAEEAATLSRRLGGLPLGLRAAGRYLASTRAALDGVSTFVAYVETFETRFGQLFPEDVADARPQEVVTATWELSLDLLTDRGLPAARPILRLITTFASAPLPITVLEPLLLRRHGLLGRTGKFRALRAAVPVVLFGARRRQRTTAAAVDEIQHVVTNLAALGLITLTSYQATQPSTAPIACLLVHPLLTEVNRHRIRCEAAHQATFSLVIQLLADVCRGHDSDDPAEALWWSLIAPHFVWSLASNPLSKSDVTTLLPSAMNTVEGLRLTGSYSAAHDLADLVYRACDAQLGPQHADTLRCRNNLAEVLYAQGRWQNSESEHRIILLVRQRLLGSRHPDTLKSRNNLAEALYAQGKWRESEVEHRNALLIRQDVFGPDDPATLRSRANFAWVLKDLQRFDEAEAESRAVLEASRRVCGADHPDTLTSHSDLAWIMREQGRLDVAEAEIRTVLQQRSRVLGPDHPDTLGSRSNLAVVLRDLGRIEEAETENRAVLKARTHVLGGDHPDTLTSRSNHAAILLDQDRVADALAENEAVLNSRTRTLGPEHPSTEISRKNLALIRDQLTGDHAGATTVKRATVTGY